MAHPKKPKRRIFLLLALIVVGFFSLLTVFGDEGLIRLKNLYGLKKRIHRENQEIFLNNQRLLQQIQLLQEPLYAERLIREKLGYVKEREYILILEDKPDSETQPNSAVHP